MPTVGLKIEQRGGVAFGIPGYLGCPVFCIGRRFSHAVAATVTMPKAAVDENDFTSPVEHEIRRSREAPDMESVPVPKPMRHSTHDHFGLGVFGLYSSHNLAALWIRSTSFRN